LGRVAAGTRGWCGCGVLDDEERSMSMEKVLWFGIGFISGYYIMAHYRKTGKAV
jgi:hypothetical protein